MKCHPCLILSLFALPLLMGCSSSSGDADNDVPVTLQDPDGTLTTSFSCERETKTHITPFGEAFPLTLDSALLLSGPHYLFATVGSVEGLAAITKIPVTSWSSAASLQGGEGCIAALVQQESVRYIRLFATKSARVVTLKYQSPFYGDATRFYPVKSEITLTPAAGSDTLIFSKPVNYSLTCSDTTWIKLQASINWFVLTCTSNTGYTPRRATVTLSNEIFSFRTISVIQSGLDESQ